MVLWSRGSCPTDRNHALPPQQPRTGCQEDQEEAAGKLPAAAAAVPSGVVVFPTPTTFAATGHVAAAGPAAPPPPPPPPSRSRTIRPPAAQLRAFGAAHRADGAARGGFGTGHGLCQLAALPPESRPTATRALAHSWLSGANGWSYHQDLRRQTRAVAPSAVSIEMGAASIEQRGVDLTKCAAGGIGISPAAACANLSLSCQQRLLSSPRRLGALLSEPAKFISAWTSTERMARDSSDNDASSEGGLSASSSNAVSPETSSTHATLKQLQLLPR